MLTQCIVLSPEEWHVDDTDKGYVVAHEAERHGAKWQSVKKVDCAIDGIEYPPRSVSWMGATALFAEEPEVGCMLMEKIANELLDSDVNIGGEISITFRCQRMRRLGAYQSAGYGSCMLCDS
jgi:hypothetical protein